MFSLYLSGVRIRRKEQSAFCRELVTKSLELAFVEQRWTMFKSDLPIASDSYMFGEDGLAKIATPMMAIGGTADTGTPFDWGTKSAFDH